MIEIEVVVETSSEVRPSLVIDRTGLGARLTQQRYGNRVEVFESQEKRSRRFLIAIVGGQRYNEYQTKQAIADGKVCHCGHCVCCEILRKSRSLGW